MANLSSIARPYATAAFETARDRKELPAWKNFLEAASYLANQPDVLNLIANPEILSSKLFDLFHEIIAKQLKMNTLQKNFLSLVADHRRLNVLPEIATLFGAYYDKLKKMSHVRLITAIETKPEFQQKLANILSKRIHSAITLQCEVNPELIGGAVIHIGDRVIDGSVRGKLNRLLENLTAPYVTTTFSHELREREDNDMREAG